MRIQLELTDRQVRDLKTLMNETELDTYKELFNNALALFRWAVDETKSGSKIASVDEDKNRYKYLVMHALEVAKRQQSQQQQQDTQQQQQELPV